MCFKKKKTAVAEETPRRGVYRRLKVHDDIVKLHGPVSVTPPSDPSWLNPVVDPKTMQPYGNETIDAPDELDEINIDEE